MFITLTQCSFNSQTLQYHFSQFYVHHIIYLILLKLFVVLFTYYYMFFYPLSLFWFCFVHCTRPIHCISLNIMKKKTVETILHRKRTTQKHRRVHKLVAFHLSQFHRLSRKIIVHPFKEEAAAAVCNHHFHPAIGKMEA